MAGPRDSSRITPDLGFRNYLEQVFLEAPPHGSTLTRGAELVRWTRTQNSFLDDFIRVLRES